MFKIKGTTLAVVAFSALAAQAGSYPNWPASRDPVQWPFSDDSHWNTPIHNDAVYVDPDLPQMGNVEVDEDILLIDTTAPIVDIKYNSVSWGSGDRCVDEGGVVHQAHIPDDFVYQPKPNGNAHEYKPNAAMAALFADGTILQSQPFTRCPGMAPTSLFTKPTVNLYGTGHGGAHGGSRMSSIGGTIRLGELVPGGVIRHVMKCNINNDYLFYDNETKGYRWPALQADGYASREYQGSFKPLRMGSLMAIPASVDISSMGFETEAMEILAKAFQDFGAYVVDDPYRNSFIIETEISPFGRVTDEFESVWGFPMHNSSHAPWKRDIDRLVDALHVVDNNSADTPGGGPKSDWANRRAPKAPPFGTGGTTQPDEPGTIQFEKTAYSVYEDKGTAVITASRTEGCSGTVTIDYATSNSTAIAGTDYTAASGTLTFADGEQQKSFDITILDNDLEQQNRTVNLELSNPGGEATLGSDSQAVLTILDDESMPDYVINSEFDTDADGWAYVDDPFRNTAQPAYASGSHTGSALQVQVGGVDNNTVFDMSGGWRKEFTLASAQTVNLSFSFDLTNDTYDTDEYTQVLVAIDGNLLGSEGNDYVTQIAGAGTRSMQTVELSTELSEGEHTLTIGLYNNKKTYNEEQGTLIIDDVRMAGLGGTTQSRLLKQSPTAHAQLRLISPNQIEIAMPAEGMYTVSLFTTNGRIVYTKSIENTTQSAMVTLELPKLAPGVYIVGLKGKDSHTIRLPLVLH